LPVPSSLSLPVPVYVPLIVVVFGAVPDEVVEELVGR
jgi:hypothetical protein